MRANEVSPEAIDAAKAFVREPLAEMFHARHTQAHTLRDGDNVTLNIQQLGHLMAWYAALRVEQREHQYRSEVIANLPAGVRELPQEAMHGE